MASIRVKKIGEEKVHFRDPSTKFELVELTFVDSRGIGHKAKFVLKDLLALLEKPKGEETVIDGIAMFIREDPRFGRRRLGDGAGLQINPVSSQTA